MSNTAREFDVVVYGASGFTGQLVAEYMHERYPQGEIRWALGGRNADKLAEVAAQSGLPADTPVVVADTGDSAALDAMAARTNVILTTVGPYQLYGTALVEACVKAGTDYVDLCGEPNWMRAMIDRFESQAKQSGARIVFSCGFDSIPSDLGVFRLQQVAHQQTGGPITAVKGRVRALQGGVSGGTVASMHATMAAAEKDPSVGELFLNPFSLTPGFEGPAQPNGGAACYDDDIDSWASPFVMAGINAPNVHRSNRLLGGRYGDDFTYSEMISTGPGEQGEALARDMPDLFFGGGETPQPGEGPSREQQETGHYEMAFFGETVDGERMTVVVSGDRDPGYGSTSRMIAECAVALAVDSLDTKGGVLTPAAAFGDRIIERLTANAGMTFISE